jgi:(1->4)-alpha-D-glucan 1-alpha-D-glucosylmutase
MLPSSTAASSQLNRIPIATYRIQLRPNFSFDQLRGLLPYFKSLGISDLYLSPLFRAREGSTHGYDVVDHGQIEPAFGGEEAFVRMAEEARAAGLGILLDVVPNHMGVNDSGNRHWLDVLENGEGARYADFFDIDWDAIPLNLKHRVLQPVLGKPFGATLEDGDLRIVYHDHRLQVAYYDRRFPLAPRTWPRVLELMLQHLEAERDAHEEHVPKCAQSGPEAIRTRYREQRIARRRLGHLVDKRPRVRAALDRALEEINGAPGDPKSFDQLEELLNAQCYRLAYWRVASDEINYRRFFDINELAAIRVEDPRVFKTVHRLIGDLLGRNVVTGLRIDHPDGLLDPAQYFNNLQSLFRRSRSEEDQDGASQVYVVAEKILSGEEQLATDWSIQGTTGYEFLNMVSRLLVDAEGVRQIRDYYEELAGVEESAAEIFYESKKEAASVAMLSEMQMLAARLYRIAQQQRFSQDYTQPALLKALQEVIASLQVYRTYVPPRGWEASEEDHRRIGLAIRWAKRRNPSMPRSLFDFIASVLLLQFPTTLDQEQREAWRHFALKLQQVSGPIAAKGVEDTAFYRYYPLASLNEVGGELDAGGLEPDDFHRLMLHRAANWPHSLSASSTHDTKRSEDLRARLHVLSELPEEWKDQVLLWRQMNKRWLHELYGEAAPDANEEYLLYQSLVGTWPLHPMDDWELEAYAKRIVAYMEKALREAKLHTSWINPSEDYEAAVFDFVHKILGPEAIAFQADLSQFVARIADAGFVNALSQVVLKLALPGVPDFYQGTELWDFSLVDPDNRRPVDFAARQAACEAISEGGERDEERLAREIAANWPDPKIKMLVTMRGLALRHRWHEVFAAGEYLPLTAEGEAAEHIFAFARMLEDRIVVAVIPRHFHSLTHRDPATATATTNSPHADWGDTTLVLPGNAPTKWQCEFTGRTLQAAENNDTLSLRAADLFEILPVALLTASKE